MKLLGIMQGVSLKGEIQNYLDFEKEDGSKFQLPVPEETVKVLLAEIYGQKPEEEIEPVPDEDPVPFEVPEDEHPEGATTFGGEEEEEEAPEEEEEQTPRSESEVPSL